MVVISKNKTAIRIANENCSPNKSFKYFLGN